MTACSTPHCPHTLAIVVAPAPDTSVIAHSLRRVLQPYLTLLRLDNQWNFYAPNPGKGHQLRYVVEDAAGTRHTFIPTDGLNRIHPNEWWFRSLYDWIAESPDKYQPGTRQALLNARTADAAQYVLAVREVEQARRGIPDKNLPDEPKSEVEPAAEPAAAADKSVTSLSSARLTK